MPYIALQLVGLEAVLRTMGINGSGFVGHLPLFIAFLVLALYTYKSGLRAPALIAFVKDGLIYLVIIVGGDLPAGQVGRLGHDLRRGLGQVRRDPVAGRRHPADRPTTSCSTRPWRSGRRWRCSSTRTRPPGSSRPAAAT